MTEVQQLANLVVSTQFEDIHQNAIEQLKIRILDSLGVAFGALGAEPMKRVRQQIDELGGAPVCSLIGGGKSAPDRAAFYNGALVRYLDFMDSYLAPGETFHPSDNFGAVLAASEYANVDGKQFMTALAVAYEVQARLSTAAPVRARGFDHTTQGAYAVAAGVSKALGLDVEKTANAIAMSGTANNALRVTRTGRLSNWKGLAYPNVAFSAMHLAFLAKYGITGSSEVFEGNKGFKDAITGPFTIDWTDKSFNSIERSIVKKYNAEIHSQSTIEATLEIKNKHQIDAYDIAGVEIKTFQVAYDIIGGGEEGSKRNVKTKEDADHSLPYMIAVALLDGSVGPAQFEEERISRPDVQNLLRKIDIKPDSQFSSRFPNEMPSRVTITLQSGKSFDFEKSDYEGFYTCPMKLESVVEKFSKLAARILSPIARKEIEYEVFNLEKTKIRSLTAILSRERNDR